MRLENERHNTIFAPISIKEHQKPQPFLNMIILNPEIA